MPDLLQHLITQSACAVPQAEALADQAQTPSYAASWKIPEPFPEFIRGLCRACAESGGLRLGVIYVGDQRVAAQIWIVNGGISTIKKSPNTPLFRGGGFSASC